MMLIAGLFCAMTTMVFTGCSSDNDDNPATNPTKESVDYTVIFYGQGGENLDMQIMDNISQFFLADASSYKKVNVVGQYKFSTAENLMENSLSEDYASKFGSKTYRFVCNSKVEYQEAWMDDVNIYGADAIARIPTRWRTSLTGLPVSVLPRTTYSSSLTTAVATCRMTTCLTSQPHVD